MQRILIADDAELLLLLDESFVRRAEMEVLTAASAEQALRTTRRERPDLLLLRADAAGSGGLEVCRQLKGDAAFSGTPVVLYGPPEALGAMREAGADASFGEPLARDALLNALRGLIGATDRAHPRRPATLRVDFYPDDQHEQVAYTKDIGAGGLFLKTREPLAGGTGLQLIFELPIAGKPTVRADGRVVRSVAADRDSYLIPGFGVEFRRISQRDRSEISRFVDG